MKKLLVVCAALAMVLAFAMPAAAHTACCEDCDCKSGIGMINCPYSGEGNELGSCDWFDYDESYAADTAITDLSSHGYTINNDCHKVLFDICCCSDVSAFIAGNTIGIRMTSLTAGFYFTSDEIFFDPYDIEDPLACSNQAMADVRSFGTTYIYKNAYGTQTGAAAKTELCDPLYKPVVKETECGTGYRLLETDIDDAFCYWWIDMPAMLYDTSVAEECSNVLVKIELISAENPGTICDDCRVICECTVDLGQYCCVDDTSECCVMFPYVLTQSSPWATGITLINLDPAAVAYGDMEVAFALTDSTGVTYTYTKDDFASDQYVWTFSLDAILGEFSGTPAAGRAYLKATANFAISGYMFLSNGNYAGGTYAAPCYSPCQVINMLDRK